MAWVHSIGTFPTDMKDENISRKGSLTLMED